MFPASSCWSGAVGGECREDPEAAGELRTAADRAGNEPLCPAQPRVLTAFLSLFPHNKWLPRDAVAPPPVASRVPRKLRCVYPPRSRTAVPLTGMSPRDGPASCGRRQATMKAAAAFRARSNIELLQRCLRRTELNYTSRKGVARTRTRARTHGGYCINVQI